MEVNPTGVAPDEQPGPLTSGSSSSGEAQDDNSMIGDSRSKQKMKRELDDSDEEKVADERLVMEVMCEDPLPQIEWEWDKDYQGELEEKPRHEEHGDWADMSDEDQRNQEVICDDLAGQILQYEHVVRARLNEVEDLKKMEVWETAPLSQCWERTGWKPIRGSWVDVNKGDDICHNYRSRYVAQEVRDAYGSTNR